eukprot:scaffold1583_cov299-Pinguiococcus_pyrenoidosus.AAC.25
MRCRPHQRRVGVLLVCLLVLLAAVLLFPRLFFDAYGSEKQLFGGTAPAPALRSRAVDACRSRFQEPTKRSSSRGELFVTLHVDAHRVHRDEQGDREGLPGDPCSPLAYTSRLYEASLPGPTLEVQPGDSLYISLVNRLGANIPLLAEASGAFLAAEQGYERMHPWNTLRFPNTTNLHVHGMHVSPAGVADNVYRELGPGKAQQHVYRIPEDHPRGVFYYHPHAHGSSGLQVFNGMAGAIIVKDRDGRLPLPEPLDGIRDFLCVLQRVNFDGGRFRSTRWNMEGSGDLLDMRVRDRLGRAVFTSAGDADAADDGYVLVNGRYRPSLEVRQDEVFRLRMVHAGANDFMRIFDPAEFPCEVAVMGRDGRYMRRTRAVGAAGLTLVPGSRADVLVRCSKPGAHLLRATEWPEDLVEAYYGSHTDTYTGLLMRLDVLPQETTDAAQAANAESDEDDGDDEDDGGEEADKVPRYVACDLPLDGIEVQDVDGEDLRAIPDTQVLKHAVQYQAGPLLERRSGEKAVNYFWYGINGNPFIGKNPSIRVPLGAVLEWTIVNMHQRSSEGELPSAPSLEQPAGRDEMTRSNHPFHLHTNHFQIVAATVGSDVVNRTGDWEIGDWRDTISVATPGNVTIRWIARDFVGWSLAHCHIFSHADTGMDMPFLIGSG